MSYVRQVPPNGTEIVHRVIRRQKDKYLVGQRAYSSLVQIITEDHAYWGFSDPCKEVFRPQLLFRRPANPQHMVLGYLQDNAT